MNQELNQKGNGWALLPFLLFIVIYLGAGLILQAQGVGMAFYQFPSVTAMFLAVIAAFCMGRETLDEKFAVFARGAANENVLTMLMIYILAGAFSTVAKTMGGVEATVNLGLSIIPVQLLIAGVFVISAFLGTATGTSVGTITALVPIAVGLASESGGSVPMMLGACAGGAMFGDNLSFISDTTIVATRTQGCQMSDKFKVNIRIALPIAILTGLIYVLVGSGVENAYAPAPIEWVKVIPYLVVLVTAVCGINVMLVLFIGIVLSGIVGLWTGSFDIWGWNASMGLGITNMGELIIVTLLAGGMLEMIRYNGGIDWIIRKLTSRIHSSKGAEMSIAALVSFANLCTANNTIALIMAGPIAKDIADRFKIDPRRSASLLDIFSCFIQGIIPYGAQMLMAAGLGHVSPIEIMQYLYYPYLLGAGALLAIAFNYPRKYTVN